MAWFLWRRRRRLQEAVSYAESLAEGRAFPRILDAGSGKVARLVAALGKIAALLEQRSFYLQKEESHLGGILATMREGVLLTDENGDIVLANLALREMFQVSASPTGKSLVEVFRKNELQQSCDELLARPGRKSFELALTFPEEKTLQVNFSTFERRGKIAGVVGVFIDVTAMKKLEAMRKDFIANISHELKTPLSSIKGYSETLLQGAPKNPARLGEFAAAIHRNAGKLERLVEDLLALSRIESCQEKPRWAAVSLPALAEEAAAQFSHALKEKKIQFQNRLAPQLPPVKADVDQIQKVFVNLLDNAVKYIQPEGRIEVEGCLQDHEVRVSVKDNGPGIAAEDLPRLFERFYRVEKSRARHAGGSGLGLSIAKHIIQQHGGKIWAESEPGKGAAFYFTLPVIASAKGAKQSP